jgi:hypothetical protein
MQFLTEFPGYFPFYIPFPYIRPLVIGFFTLTESQFHLNPAILKIKRQRNKGISLFLHLPVDTFDFFPMEEELFLPVRIVVKDRGEGIFRDAEGTEPYFSPDYLGPCVGKRDLPIPDGFYLRSPQFKAAFVMVVHGIIMPGSAVHGDDLYSLTHGLPWEL